MTLEQVIDLARQAEVLSLCKSYPDQFQRFAKLVRDVALDEAAEHIEITAGVWLGHAQAQADVTAKEIRGLKS